MRARQWSVLLAAFSRLHPALCCSTATFELVYKDYPDCAAACLACEDDDYSNNFAHACNYTSGDCCQSQHHTAIGATWACVNAGCGKDLAQQAFDTFVSFCDDHGNPLAAADVPSGYEDANAPGEWSVRSAVGEGPPQRHAANRWRLVGSDGSSGAGTNGNGSSSRLSNGEIAGTVIGTIAGVAGIMGSIYAYLTYRKKKASRLRGTENTLQVIHAGQRPHQVGIPAAVFHGNADASVIYTRETQSSSFLNGKHVTKETFEIRRQGGVVTSSDITEEVD